MKNHSNQHYILAYNAIDIDHPTSKSCVLYTKKHIFVLTYDDLTSGVIKYDGKTAYDVFTAAVNENMDAASVETAGRECILRHGGKEIVLENLKNFVVKNGFFSRGVYIREHINTIKKFNQAITVRGSELGGNLQEFYKELQLQSWTK